MLEVHNFTFFRGGGFAVFRHLPESTDVRSCHTWLSIRVLVLLENVRFMVVSCSFQVLCKKGTVNLLGIYRSH